MEILHLLSCLAAVQERSSRDRRGGEPCHSRTLPRGGRGGSVRDHEANREPFGLVSTRVEERQKGEPPGWCCRRSTVFGARRSTACTCPTRRTRSRERCAPPRTSPSSLASDSDAALPSVS